MKTKGLGQQMAEAVFDQMLRAGEDQHCTDDMRVEFNRRLDVHFAAGAGAAKIWFEEIYQDWVDEMKGEAAIAAHEDRAAQADWYRDDPPPF